jgi:hypothetical protein
MAMAVLLNEPTQHERAASREVVMDMPRYGFSCDSSSCLPLAPWLLLPSAHWQNDPVVVPTPTHHWQDDPLANPLGNDDH